MKMRSKGVSQIMQFILFFVIGLTLFLAIGNFFRGQLNVFADDIGEVNRKAVASFIGAHAISQFAECKLCDNVNATFKIQNTTANFVLQMTLDGEGLKVATHPGGKSFVSGVHNILISLTDLSGSVSSVEPIVLSLTKNENKLRVCKPGAC